MENQIRIISKEEAEKEQTAIEMAEAKKVETREIILTILLTALVMLIVYIIAGSRKKQSILSLMDALPMIDGIKDTSEKTEA